MRILIYGAGAVGGYFAARLAHAGHDVTVIVREVMAAAINDNGLIVTEAEARIQTHPTAVVSVAQAFAEGSSPYDLIILGMKSYDLGPALDPLTAFCPDPPTIITTQNGIDVERPYVAHYGVEKVIAGSVTLPIRKVTTNHLKVEREDRGFALAPIKPKQNIKAWVQLFQEADITTEGIKDYQSMKWSKAFLNIVGNATSAILNRPPDVIYKSDALFDLEIRMLRETLTVMKKLKIDVVDLPGAPATRLAMGVKRLPKMLMHPILTSLVGKGRGDKMPSFHIDLASGKGRSEVIYHNRVIAKAGKAKGVPTPVNMALAEVLWKLTRETIDWREFDGRPKQLLKVVKHYERAMKK